MKILLTADPELPVPPRFYGGIERIVDLLANGLVERGHDVTLIAHPDSRTRARLVPYRNPDWRSRKAMLDNMWLTARTVVSGKFDFVHSHSRLAYFLPVLHLRVPKLMSYQRRVTPSSVRWARRLAGPSIEFSAVSENMIGDLRRLAPWHVVYNGVPLDAFRFAPEVVADAPLVFLGRVEPIKGPHLAIEVARRAGRRLVLAGNIPQEHQGFFDAEIAPHLDGDAVSYIGPVDDRAKNELLGAAAALLMPILWDEPFGIVMAEAMACGTPVIALRRGSVPEVVEDGVSGFVREDVEGMVTAVGHLASLTRADCRRRVETSFSEDNVVSNFLRVYNSVSMHAGVQTPRHLSGSA